MSLPLLLTAVFCSLVMPQPRPLAEVVAQSDTIVVVDYSKAKSRAIKVPVRKGAPFVRQQSPWIVKEVVKGDAKLVGQTIYVDVYDWRFNLAMMETSREGGPLPSKNVPSYKMLAKRAPQMPEPMIFFLRKEADDAYEPTVMDAIESVKHLDQVKAALAKP